MLEPQPSKAALSLATTTTLNAVIRASNTTGGTKNSGVIIDDSNNVTGVAALTLSGILSGTDIRSLSGATLGARIYTSGSDGVIDAASGSLLLQAGSGTKVTIANTMVTVAASGGLTVSAGTTAVQALTATGSVAVSGTAGSNRLVRLQTSGVVRWDMAVGAGAESGANAGSAWSLSAYTDAGAYIDDPINVARAAGGAIGIARPTFITPATGTTLTIASTNATALSCAGGASFAATVTGTGVTLNGTGFTQISTAFSTSYRNTTNTAGFDIGLLAGSGDATAYLYQRHNASILCFTNNALLLSMTASGLEVASGKTLKLGNTYVAGAPGATTGTITIQDAAGTTYRIPVLV